MPTGYTHKIADGISFKEYALSCARNFGALILMRDDPADAPIPEKFEPSSFYAENVERDKERLRKLIEMTPEQAVVACNADYTEKHAAWQKRKNERADLRAKYEAMLVQARAYKSPSLDHDKYKQFMIDQIVQSIDFDCSGSYDVEPQLERPAEWLERQRLEATRSYNYSLKSHADEIERTEGRNRWVQQLRESLESTQQ